MFEKVHDGTRLRTNFGLSGVEYSGISACSYLLISCSCDAGLSPAFRAVGTDGSSGRGPGEIRVPNRSGVHNLLWLSRHHSSSYAYPYGHTSGIIGWGDGRALWGAFWRLPHCKRLRKRSPPSPQKPHVLHVFFFSPNPHPAAPL